MVDKATYHIESTLPTVLFDPLSDQILEKSFIRNPVANLHLLGLKTDSPSFQTQLALSQHRYLTSLALARVFGLLPCSSASMPHKFSFSNPMVVPFTNPIIVPFSVVSFSRPVINNHVIV